MNRITRYQPEPLLLVARHQRFQLWNQTRKVMRHGFPDASQIDIEVSVHETVSHPDYIVPWNFRMCLSFSLASRVASSISSK